MISLYDGETVAPPVVEPVPLHTVLSKELMLLSRYKTIPCVHFHMMTGISASCPHDICNFSH